MYKGKDISHPEILYDVGGEKHGFMEYQLTFGVPIARCFCGNDYPCSIFVELLLEEVSNARKIALIIQTAVSNSQ